MAFHEQLKRKRKRMILTRSRTTGRRRIWVCHKQYAGFGLFSPNQVLILCYGNQGYMSRGLLAFLGLYVHNVRSNVHRKSLPKVKSISCCECSREMYLCYYQKDLNAGPEPYLIYGLLGLAPKP